MHTTLTDYYNTPLCNLDWGDPFEFNGAIYMLARSCGLVEAVNSGGEFVCVNVCDGSLTLIKGSEKIHQLRADVVIGEYK